MTTWTQNYDPFGHWWLSALIACLPIAVLFTLFAIGRVKAHVSALIAGGCAVLIAIFAFRMPPHMASISFVYGICYGLLKIAWIVVAAVYLYEVSVYTGQFEILKYSVSNVTPDRRIQLLLVAFCFGVNRSDQYSM